MEEDNGVCFDIDVLQGLLVGHWNYGLEDMRREVVERFGAGASLMFPAAIGARLMLNM